MRIIIRFEVEMKMKNGTVWSSDYDSYGEAYDAAVLKASEKLPKECCEEFVINKVYRNYAK